MNHTKAVFKAGKKYITAKSSLTQYDYGQVLDIEGLELPYSFEADFSNSPVSGDSRPVLGEDGSVSIPDEYLVSGEPVYVFLFLHQGDSDGSTEYRVMINVNRRPSRDMIEPTAAEQSMIEQALAAAEAATNDAHEAAEDARAAAEEARAAAEEAHAAAEAARAAAEEARLAQFNTVTFGLGTEDEVTLSAGDVKALLALIGG